jgi:type III secretory pathway component EscU
MILEWKVRNYFRVFSLGVLVQVCEVKFWVSFLRLSSRFKAMKRLRVQGSRVAVCGFPKALRCVIWDLRFEVYGLHILFLRSGVQDYSFEVSNSRVRFYDL